MWAMSVVRSLEGRPSERDSKLILNTVSAEAGAGLSLAIKSTNYDIFERLTKIATNSYNTFLYKPMQYDVG